MKKSLIAFLCGILFSGLISLVIVNVQKENLVSTRQLFYIQTGVYKTKDNAISMQLKLSELNIESYIYDKEQLYYVICGISEKNKELDSFKEILNHHQISFVCKDVQVEVNNNDLIQQLLEVLSS